MKDEQILRYALDNDLNISRTRDLFHKIDIVVSSACYFTIGVCTAILMFFALGW